MLLARIVLFPELIMKIPVLLALSLTFIELFAIIFLCAAARTRIPVVLLHVALTILMVFDTMTLSVCWVAIPMQPLVPLLKTVLLVTLELPARLVAKKIQKLFSTVPFA